MISEYNLIELGVTSFIGNGARIELEKETKQKVISKKNNLELEED